MRNIPRPPAEEEVSGVCARACKHRTHLGGSARSLFRSCDSGNADLKGGSWRGLSFLYLLCYFIEILSQAGASPSRNKRQQKTEREHNVKIGEMPYCPAAVIKTKH